MSLSTGARLGPYEIVSRAGAGGMGEVYRARDTRLQRTVAIKVLPPDRMSDPAARQRLEREARAVAALSHPHICPLFDIGHHEGTDFLVMEFVEGETLAHRLGRGKLPLDEALQYGIEIADALAAAHRAGIIHRDMKPGNVMLTKSGAKLLDFGLAKPRPAVVSGNTITAADPLTGEGTVLGTLQYMAPEQLEGKETDARTDIFAFGATLYEMAAGRKAFEAATDASLVGAILRDDPPLVTATLPFAPRALDRVIRTCMAKDPDERWQSAGDLKREIAWIRDEHHASTSDRTAPPFRSLTWRRVAAVAATLVLVAWTAALVLRSRGPAGAIQPTARFTMHLPDSAVYSSMPLAQMSPDGRRVASVVDDAAGRISIRRLDAQAAATVPLTEGAATLFWSADSQRLGFTTQSAVKLLNVSDNTVETLCDGCRPGYGATWSRTGLIVFTSLDGMLLGIPAAGGEPKAITSLDRTKGEIAHIAPYFLPDGDRYLFLIRNADARRTGLYIGQVGSSERRLLLQGEHPAIYASPGYLLFTRGGNIVAQPFDVKRLELSGEALTLVAPSDYWPTPVHSSDLVYLNWFGAWPSVSTSSTGLLTYTIAEHPQSQFQWVSRSGQLLQRVGEPGSYMTFDLAPDDTRVVFSGGEGTLASLWLLDLLRGVTSRVTFGSSSAYYDPRWGPGGQWIGANRPSPPPGGIFRILADGRDVDVFAPGTEVCILDDLSRDGRALLCRRGGRDLLAVSLGDRQVPVTIRKAQAGFIDQAQFSPDGHWIAYNGSESGRHEVYVTRFPASAERWQISDNGGVQPVWRQDGRELYFLALDGALMAVTPRADAGSPFSPARRLFDTSLAAPSPSIEQYAASADGQRFLLLKPLDDKVRNSVGVILNWPELLQHRQ